MQLAATFDLWLRFCTVWFTSRGSYGDGAPQKNCLDLDNCYLVVFLTKTIFWTLLYYKYVCHLRPVFSVRPRSLCCFFFANPWSIPFFVQPWCVCWLRPYPSALVATREMYTLTPRLQNQHNFLSNRFL